MSGHIFAGSQRVEKYGCVLMGHAGELIERHVYNGGQTVREGGLAIMGSVSEKLAIALCGSGENRNRARDDIVNETEAGNESEYSQDVLDVNVDNTVDYSFNDNSDHMDWSQ